MAYLAAYDAALALWPVPCDCLCVPTRMGTTHVIASGPESSPALVLLPMLSISSTMWYPNVAGLSRAYRVYAIDTLQDLGKSVPSRARGTRPASAGWLLDVLDGLEIDRAFMVGASYGGWLALNLAIAAPHRLRRIALLAPAGGLAPLSLRFFAAMLPAVLFPTPSTVSNAAHALAAEGFAADARLIQQLTVGFQNYRAWSMVGMALPRVFRDGELRQIEIPVLLLLGEHEIICDPQSAIRRATRLIPNVEAEVIPNAGHGLSLEQPGVVNARVLRFFEAT